MKQLLFMTAVLAASLHTYAQTTLKGKVFDGANNTPLSGATVTLSGKSTTTDKDGSFSIDCNNLGKLTISFIGYTAYQHAIKNCGETLSVSLTPSNSTLAEVEITATSAQNKSLLNQPTSITKLTQLEIKRGTGLFLDDALVQNVPGVTMNRRTVSGGQQFNIRGYGNGTRGTRGVSSNFDAQGYKVYLNRIAITDAEGITVMDDIDFGSIGNVEVVKGPAGTLYGLAIGGVVNLKTVRPEKGKTSISQEAMVGNYGLQRYTTQFASGSERSSILLNYGHQKSNGFTIHNASHKDFVNFVGDFHPNVKQSITTYAGYSNSYDQRSGELTIKQFEENDFSGNLEYIKRDAHSQVYTLRAGIGHTYAFSNHLSNTTSVFGTGFNSNVSSAGGWTDKSNLNVGLRSTFDTKFSLSNAISLNGITGLETQFQQAQQVGYKMIDPLGKGRVWKLGDPYYIVGDTLIGSNGTTSNVNYSAATTSLFTEWTLGLPKDLSITAGIGYSKMNLNLNDRFLNFTATPTKPTHFDTTYANMFSPHVAINKVFNKSISVYAAYSKAYKAPVSSYFYIPFVGGNPATGKVNSDLKAEYADQFEIGTKGILFNGRFNYQLALFDALFKDKMTTIGVPNPSNTATAYSYVVNTGKEDHKGVELLIKTMVYQSATSFVASISPFINATYSDFTYTNYKFQTIGKTVTAPAKDSIITYNYSGHAVAGVSKWVANAGVDFLTKPGIYGNVVYSYRDGFPITSLGTDTGTDKGTPYNVSGWGLLNAKLGFRNTLSKRFDLDLYFGANNITGEKYPMMVFVNQIPDAYIAGPKKAVYFGGINLKYNF